MFDSFLPEAETPAVRITMGGNGVAFIRHTKAKNVGDHWKNCRKICKDNGFPHDGVNAYRGPQVRLPEVCAAFKQAGWELDLDESVKLYLQRTVIEADKQSSWVLDNIARMEESSGKKFRGYQVEDSRWMARVGSGINGNEMRTGKTVEILALFKDQAMVVCPLAAVAVWAKHVREWTPWLTPVVIDHPSKFCWPEAGQVTILHYDAMPETFKGRPVRDTVLVFDEAHFLKNPRTQRYKKADKLVAGVFEQQGRVWLASGSPAPNKPAAELWTLMELLRVGKKLFGSARSFSKAARFDPTGQVAGTLTRVMVRRLRKHVAAEMPPKQRETLVLELPPDETVGVLDQTWKLIKERGLDKEPDKLLKALFSDPDFQSYSRIRKALAVWKTAYAVQWAEEMNEAEEPGIIFSAHVEPVETIAREVPGWRCIHGGVSPAERERIVEAFQTGKCNIAVTIKTAGFALDFSRSTTSLFIDRSWTPGDNLQAEDRCINLEEPLPRSYTFLELNHPLEEHIANVLARKTAEIESTVDRVSTLAMDPDQELRQAKEMLEAHCKDSGPSNDELAAMNAALDSFF